MRILHESSLYKQNAFLTLTYNDEKLPEGGTLVVRHHQLFMKRLKKHYKGKRIRFYHCGEYGENTHRPHYHTILFNHDFEDKVFLKHTETGHAVYTSAILDKIWGHGNCVIGNVTFESAAYCGRYVMGKLTGNRKSEYGSRVPEYSTQSRNPGVGSPWLLKYKSDVYPHDFCVMNGKRVKVPKYYDSFLNNTPIGKIVLDEHDFPIFMPDLKFNELEQYKNRRVRGAAKHSADNTPERLAVREEIQQRRIDRLTRS